MFFSEHESVLAHLENDRCNGGAVVDATVVSASHGQVQEREHVPQIRLPFHAEPRVKLCEERLDVDEAHTRLGSWKLLENSLAEDLHLAVPLAVRHDAEGLVARHEGLLQVLLEAGEDHLQRGRVIHVGLRDAREAGAEGRDARPLRLYEELLLVCYLERR